MNKTRGEYVSRPSMSFFVPPLARLPRKQIAVLMALTLGGIMTSCTTIPADHSMVSSDWLRTQPREAEHPQRHAGGVAHQDIHLPSTRPQRPRPAPQQAPGQTAEAVASQPGQKQIQPPPFPPHYGHSLLIGHRRMRHHVSRYPAIFGDRRKVSQNYERSVETIGPAMVPRGIVPVVDWSADTNSFRGR